MVKNLPSNAGDAGLIPGQGTKIPHSMCTGQGEAGGTKPTCCNY